MSNLPNRIRELRLKKGFSQQQLADLIHVSKPTISELETGKMQLTVDYMRRIGKALERAPAELLPDDHHVLALTDSEIALVLNFRAADAIQREMISRVAAPREPIDGSRPSDTETFSHVNIDQTRNAA